MLEISDLRTYFHTDDGVVKAVDDVSLAIQEGQTLGIVGEAGSGKSVTALTIMRLLGGTAKIETGQISFLGRDLVRLPEPEMRQIRGKEISMIFQEPMTSLNPVFTVGWQVMEAILLHQKVTQGRGPAADDRAVPRSRHPRAGAADRFVSAPDVGRAEAAGDDRDGPVVQPASC